MSSLVEILLLTLLAGLAIPAGAALASIENISPRWLETEIRHGIVAFGGGALLSAVAFVLVPEGSKNLGIFPVSLCFLFGGATFLVLEILLRRSGTSLSQLIALLSDFIPEALALGAAIALGESGVLLLAILMALQNAPEGFNSYRELRASNHWSAKTILLSLVLIAMLGPVSGLVGHYLLAGYPALVSAIMMFGAGGILYIVLGDIAPQASLARHWLPALGALCGFLAGIIGHMLVA